MGPTRRRAQSFRRRRGAARLRRRAFVRSVLVLLFVVLLFAGVYFGTRRPAVTLAGVQVSGEQTLAPEVIKERVDAVLAGTYAFLIPKRFRYLYPKSELTAAIAALPAVQEASVSRTGAQLAIEIKEYTPHALWCTLENSVITTSCVYLAETGFAYRHAPQLSGESMLRYASASRAPTEGVLFADASFMRRSEQFVDALEREHALRVTGVIETRTGDLRYLLRGGGELLVAQEAQLEDVFANLASVLASEQYRHLSAGSFEYIDLRFGSNVYVKEEPVESEETAGEERATASSTVAEPD